MIISISSAHASEIEPTGITVIDFGIYNSEKQLTHELKTWQPYQIIVNFKSNLDYTVIYEYVLQIIDKDKTIDEIINSYIISDPLKPNESSTIIYNYYPEYSGDFRTYVEFRKEGGSTSIGDIPQYDFQVEYKMKPVREKMPSGIATVETYYPPLHQLRMGDDPATVKCYGGKILKFKVTTNNPLCLFPDSVPKLLERGFAKNNFE